MIAIRRARPDDVDFLHELVNDEDVEPFLGGRAALDRDSLLREIKRSTTESDDFGRFVIELDGERAGVMGFEVANTPSRIAHLERLAVHPSFRGRRIADEAARIFQRYLFDELGYHRLQLEIYGFNERALAHAERAGFVREGVRRQAYLRHGEWVDGILFGMLAEDLLLAAHVESFNAGVRTGDWSEMLERFADEAELEFHGVPVGPFVGKEAIAAAYREQPPDDELRVLEHSVRDSVVEARYAWLADPNVAAGDMVITVERGLIRRLVVSFDG